MRPEDKLMDLAIGGGGDEEVEEVEVVRTKDPEPELVEKTTTIREIRRPTRDVEIVDEE